VHTYFTLRPTIAEREREREKAGRGEERERVRASDEMRKEATIACDPALCAPKKLYMRDDNKENERGESNTLFMLNNSLNLK
jgi:hypothetical protein